MPLVSIARELRKAQAGGYAIPLFDSFERMGSDGMFLAIEEKRAPAIVGIYSGALDQPGGEAYVAYLREMCQRASTPVSLMLDHGSSYEHCIRALKLGCSDVMFDGSRLPLEENIAITRMVVRAAHALGAGAEAELGHVGRGTDYGDLEAVRKGFTNPADAERFVEETGVDYLAIAIGTAHGVYKGEPLLDLELLQEIRRRIDIPLVLHGGSGLSEAQFRAAIEGGIAKINIFTDLALTAGHRMLEKAHQEDASFFSLLSAVHDAFRERCGYYLDLFGASGRA